MHTSVAGPLFSYLAPMYSLFLWEAFFRHRKFDDLVRKRFFDIKISTIYLGSIFRTSKR